jgi:hypothetical protein
MATSITILQAPTTGAEAALIAGQDKPRRIAPDTGRALVILSHSIEYLADEYAHNGSPDPGQVDAIQLLMAVNRQIYLACPELPTLRQRLFTHYCAAS